MSITPLPRELDIRKLASSESAKQGVIEISVLPRFAELLHAAEGVVDVALHFHRDENRIIVIEAKLGASVPILCQRCLSPMIYSISAEVKLGVVHSEEQMQHLSKQYDPWLLGETFFEEGGLADIYEPLEDELILSLPYTSYHAEEDCLVTLPKCEQPATTEQTSAENPFRVLKGLTQQNTDELN